MKPADRIHRLVSDGKVTREEGERLLGALGPERPARPSWMLAVDPFDRFGGGVAAAAGLAVCLASLGLAHLGAHFDGFLDVHVGQGQVPVGAALLEQAMAWLAPAALFWAFARAFVRHVRWIDFVGFIGLARVPLVLMAVMVCVLNPDMPVPPRVTPAILAVALAGLPLLGWFLLLVYRGFRNATGLPAASGRLVGGYVGLLVVSEVVSKAVLHLSH